MTASVESNPLLATFNELLERLTLLHGLVFSLSVQLKASGNFYKRWLEETQHDSAMPIFGSRLVVFDTSEPRDEKGAQRLVPSGRFIVTQEKLDDLIEELSQNWGAWSLSQGYETFETFLFDIVAAFLNENGGDADPNQLRRFRKRIQSNTFTPNDWRRFTRHAYRGKNNRKILKVLRQLSRTLRKTEQQHNREIDYSCWLESMAIARHAATHSQGVVPQESLTPQVRAFLEHWLRGDTTDKGFHLKIRIKDAQETLTLLAEYAFLVFKSLSLDHNYECKLDC